MTVNQVAISGNLTRSAELRKTAKGISVLTFCVAVNERRRNPETGEWNNVPNYIDCTVFGGYAEFLSDHLFKGTRVHVGGRLRWESWEKDGQKHSKVSVIAQEVDYFESKRSNSDESQPAESASAENEAAAPSASYSEVPQFEEVTDGVYDDDIPF